MIIVDKKTWKQNAAKRMADHKEEMTTLDKTLWKENMEKKRNEKQD